MRLAHPAAEAEDEAAQEVGKEQREEEEALGQRRVSGELEETQSREFSAV